MRAHLDELTRSHEEMALRLDASAAEGTALTQRAEALQAALDAKAESVGALEKELADRDAMLARQKEEKLAAKAKENAVK